MPITPPKSKTRRSSLLPIIVAITTDVLKFGTFCLLILLARQVVLTMDRLPEIESGDCRSYAARHADFAASPRMRACLMLEQTRGP